MEDKDFIGKEYLQNCGDILFVIEKTNQKNKNGNYLFRCQFKKYPYEVLIGKREVLKKQVLNPQIEQVEFIKKIWPQKCGDSLKIIEKTNIKDNQNHHYLYRCQFLKYPCEVLVQKANILKGTCYNPEIEYIEFQSKIWPQHCGDSLRIIKKIDKKGNDKSFFWECEFIKYPYKVFVTKARVESGYVSNPLMVDIDFIGQKFIQKNGDIIKILEKTDKRDNQGAIIYKGIFIKSGEIIYSCKGEIKRGNLDDKSKYLYLFKDKLENYLINFKGVPTLYNISESLKISDTTLGQKIKEFGLEKYIKYYISNCENVIKEYIESLINDKIKQTIELKKDNKYYEIDIYIPSLKIGFEYNGNYWHSDLYKKQEYHQKKTLIAKEYNIQLFHIWEWEWINKEEKIKNYIKSKLSIFDNKIGARQCKIKQIKDNNIYRNFCDKNHLQNKCDAKIKLGLYYKDELVQIMSFGSPRFTSEYEWEIIRECSKLGYCILGGKQKLWNYFIKKWNPNSVISYCDFSKFTGESYLRLGFKFLRLNKPGFWWWKEGKDILLRTPWKHQEIKNKGYNKLYDCGQLVFLWKNKDVNKI